MAQDTQTGPGGSVADIQSDRQADNLQDADTLADMRNADPNLPERQDDRAGDELTDTPGPDEMQLETDSDAIDGGTNDSDLGADVAGLPDTGTKGSDAGLDNSARTSADPTGDRATGLGAFRD